MCGTKWLFSFLACGLLLGPSLSKFHSADRETHEFLPLTSDFQKSQLDQQLEFPRNFRTTADEIQASDKHVSLEGFQTLNIGGTSQFNEMQLAAILNRLEKPVLVIDLRAETHLIFEDITGKQIPISAYASQNSGNEGKGVEEIVPELLRYRTNIARQESILLHFTRASEVVFDKDDPQFYVANIYTEEEVVKKLNARSPMLVEYALLPVTDHKTPSTEVVDRFLEIFREVKSRDDNPLVLFHCKAGRGRTGLFMNMADIIQNAVPYDLTLEEIVARQTLLGSPDYLEVKEGREENSEARNSFLKQFYLFVKAEDGYSAGTTFTAWSLKQE